MPLVEYEYDVFISYRRSGGAATWVEKHFKPTLTDCLAYELAQEPRIYFDGEIEVGGTWPVALGRKLARSKVLVCLWSKNYLQSHWCSTELSIMLAREAGLNLRTPEKPEGLVAIGVIHDGEYLPHTLGSIQRFDLGDYFNTRMRTRSALAERLEKELRRHAPALARMIEIAPACREDWAADSATRFYDLYRATEMPRQSIPPTFTADPSVPSSD